MTELSRARPRALAAAIAVVATSLVGIAVAVPIPLWTALVAAGMLAGIAGFAHWIGERACVDAAVVAALLLLLLRVPVAGIWPVPAGLAILGALAVARGEHRLADWRIWFRIGHVRPTGWAMIAGVVAVTIPALLLWKATTGGALPETYQYLLDSAAWPVALLLVLAFLILNGAIEDTLFSGLLLTANARTMPTAVAVALTAAAFATAHLRGIPGGLLGVAMVFLWGIALTVLRLRTRGMLATYLAHVAADATIVVMLGTLTTHGPVAP